MSTGNSGGGGRQWSEGNRGGGGGGGYGGGGGNRGPGGGGHGGAAPAASAAGTGQDWLAKVKVAGELDRDLFSATAREVADVLAADGRGNNKPTQIRRFYDEFERLQAAVGNDADKFRHNLPYIMKLNADVAYAQGRGNVSAKFAQLIGVLLKQVRDGDAEVLRNAKVFFESYLCFAKLRDALDKR